MTFSLTGKAAFRRPQSDGFPQGLQWEADGTPLGDRHVQTVNLVGFGSGGVTRDEDTLTVVAAAAAAAAPGSGATPSFFSARDTNGQSSGTTVIFDSVVAPGIASASPNVSYNPATGVATVLQACIGRFEASLVLDPGIESVGTTPSVFIRVSGTDYGYGKVSVASSAFSVSIHVSTGWLALTPGMLVSVVVSPAFDGTNGVTLVSGVSTRFSGEFFAV